MSWEQRLPRCCQQHLDCDYHVSCDELPIDQRQRPQAGNHRALPSHQNLASDSRLYLFRNLRYWSAAARTPIGRYCAPASQQRQGRPPALPLLCWRPRTDAIVTCKFPLRFASIPSFWYGYPAGVGRFDLAEHRRPATMTTKRWAPVRALSKNPASFAHECASRPLERPCAILMRRDTASARHDTNRRSHGRNKPAGARGKVGGRAKLAW